MANVTSTDDDGESKQLPDCIQSENGPVLTDLGRMQVRISKDFACILESIKCI